MLRIIQPEVGTILSFPNHVLIWIKEGHGLIEVDFKTYSNFADKLIFLSPEQAIKFVFGELKVGIVEFPENFVSNSKDYRVLFKHLISLGYVEFSEGHQKVLKENLHVLPNKILDISTDQWYWQNPFQANREEYTLMFDLKDTIDAHFNESWSVEQFIQNSQHEAFTIQKVVRNRLGLTVKNLAQKKLLIESQKDIAFTEKPIQEVAYDLGFKDPAYFNRFFKKKTQLTPKEFRKQFGAQNLTDEFIQDLLFLIQQHHKSNRSTAFYADNLHMSIKTLSRKVKDKLNMTVGDLIRSEIINSSKSLLAETSIHETAYELGFKEANHFSSFFKKYTGSPPSDFQQTL